MEVKEEYISDDSNASIYSDDSSVISNDSDIEYDPESLKEYLEIDINNLPPPPDRFFFTAVPSVHIQNDYCDILRYFEYFINEEFINLIVIETNRNAEEGIKTEDRKRFSRKRNWKETNGNEIYVFITLHLLQGIVNKPVLEWYWSKKYSIDTPFVRNTMTYERYNLLKSYIHFVDEKQFVPESHPCPKLYKIWPVLKMMNKLFQSAMTPDRDLILDDNNSLHKGSIGVNQIKSSSPGMPVQTYVICEAKSGYIWSVFLYSGKDTIDPNSEKLLKPTKIALELLAHLLDQGYCITSNSFYTSPELAEILVKRKTDIFGMVQSGRRDVPTPITKKILNKGEIIAFQRQKLCIMKWKGTRESTILSTIHNPDFNEVYKKNILTFVPKAISEYNLTMGTSNSSEEKSYCLNARKRSKKYYYKIFVHLLDQATWNAYILYKKQGGTKLHLQFRLQLIDMLIEKYYVAESHTNAASLRGRGSTSVNPSRLVERHFLDFIPPTPKKERPTKYCHICCSRRKEDGKKVRKETRFQCSDCNLGLCIPCFKIYHTQAHWK